MTGGDGGPPAIPGRLRIRPDGRLHGPANITYNDPWPLKFAAAGVTGKMRGTVLHTSVSSFEECIKIFNSPGTQGSAHFVVGGVPSDGRHEGEIRQFVPIGKGFETFHAYAANHEFYGVETSDGGKPHVPISDPGLWAWAQLHEFLSRYAGFPLWEMRRYSGRGLGYHRQFDAWNLSHHTCPGASMSDMVRVNQRAEIIKRARRIREQP